MGRKCELQPPTLTQFDAWGNRIDHVNTCKEWQEMKHIAAAEGLIAHGYERKFGQWRLVKFFLLLCEIGSACLHTENLKTWFVELIY